MNVLVKARHVGDNIVNSWRDVSSSSVIGVRWGGII